MDKQEGVNCAVFRNEGAERWPAQRLYTYVNGKRVKSRNPGYCFLMAGWRKCGFTKGGLLILESIWGANPIYERYLTSAALPQTPDLSGQANGGLPKDNQIVQNLEK